MLHALESAPAHPVGEVEGPMAGDDLAAEGLPHAEMPRTPRHVLALADKPVVTPPTARSPLSRMESACRSMLRARSNTRSAGAAMVVINSKVGMTQGGSKFGRDALGVEPFALGLPAAIL